MEMKFEFWILRFSPPPHLMFRLCFLDASIFQPQGRTPHAPQKVQHLLGGKLAEAGRGPPGGKSGSTSPQTLYFLIWRVEGQNKAPTRHKLAAQLGIKPG